jgi:integrase
MARNRLALDDAAVALLTPSAAGCRNFGVPGLLLRTGARRKSWELRIERGPKADHVRRALGEFPAVTVAQAKATAEAMWARYEAHEPVDGVPKDKASIKSTWPLFRQRLEDDHKSPLTITAYESRMKRLSEATLQRPLRELARDPTIMEAEVAAIKKRLDNKPRKGHAAASQTARFVSVLFKFARNRDPDLLGNPVSAVATKDVEQDDLPILHYADMAAWMKAVRKLPNAIEQEALLFTLLSGLRRNSLVELKWADLRKPILKSRALRIPTPKGGKDRSFDLVLSRPMLRCLWRARRASRMLFPEHAETYVFAGTVKGHVSGNHLTKLGVASNHALRRSYASEARAAGVPFDSVGRLLNHKAGGVTAHYIRGSALGALQLAEQETISAHLISGLGRPNGL